MSKMVSDLTGTCQDHIFALSSIIENRFHSKKDTLVCFNNMFDCVDLLWQKLNSRYGIEGRFMLALQALSKEVRSQLE